MRVRLEAAAIMFFASLVIGTVVYFIERAFIKLTPGFVPVFVAMLTVLGFAAPRYAKPFREIFSRLSQKRGGR